MTPERRLVADCETIIKYVRESNRIPETEMLRTAMIGLANSLSHYIEMIEKRRHDEAE